MSKTESDIELVNRVKSGDTSAFDFLVIKYQRRVIRLLSRIVRDPVEVEDIAQESFLKAFRKDSCAISSTSTGSRTILESNLITRL